MAAPAPGQSQQDYLLGLLNGGMAPQQAADAFNSTYNLPTGSSAAYYPQYNSVNLPGWYAAGPTATDGQSGWGIVQKPQSGGGGAGANLASLLGGSAAPLPQVTTAPNFSPFTPLDPQGSQNAQQTLAALLAGHG